MNVAGLMKHYVARSEEPSRARKRFRIIPDPDPEEPLKDSDDDQPSGESCSDNWKDAGALALPPDYAYLKGQVHSCKRYLSTVRVVLLEGPGDGLNLGPIRAGKSHTLVLDVDNTMLFAFISKNGYPLTSGVRPISEPNATTFLGTKLVEVWYRPGLMEFLTDVSKHYDIVVFSAGGKLYVEWIVSVVDPEKLHVSVALSREEMSKYMQLRENPCGLLLGFEEAELMLVKNINGFFSGPHQRPQERVVCVDDRIYYFIYNLGNVVPIRAFYGDANDYELTQLRAFLLSHLEASDIREEIKKRYDLSAHVQLDGKDQHWSSYASMIMYKEM